VGLPVLVHSVIQGKCLCKLIRNCLDVYSLGLDNVNNSSGRAGVFTAYCHILKLAT
jgi:hypothetical protein